MSLHQHKLLQIIIPVCTDINKDKYGSNKFHYTHATRFFIHLCAEDKAEFFSRDNTTQLLITGNLLHLSTYTRKRVLYQVTKLPRYVFKMTQATC